MPLIWAALWGALLMVLETLVGKILISLGIGYISYSGVDAGISWAKAQFLSSLSGLPADAVAIAGTMKIGVCVSMLLSALTVRLVLAGMTSGTIKRMAVK